MNSFLNFITKSELESFRDIRRKIRRAKRVFLVGVRDQTDNFTKSSSKKTFFLAQIFVARARARTFGEGVKIWRYLFWLENGGAKATQSKFFVDPF